MTRHIRNLRDLGPLTLGVLGAALVPSADRAHAGGPADLFVGSITITPYPNQGLVVIQVYVQNLGGTAAQDFWIEVQVTGYPTSFIFEDHLGANGTAIYAVPLRDPCGVTKHSVTATADSTSVVVESDEANNSLVKELAW
jgi:subtilase family serine protease